MTDDMLRGGNFSVVEGRDGWLFLDQADSVEIMRLYTDPDYMPRDVVTAWAKALRDRRDYFAELGITYVTLVVPDACTVYPEKLPPSITMNGVTPFSLIAAELDEETLAQCLHPVAELVAGRSERATFRPSDSHWTDWGAYLGYRATMERLSQDRDDLEILAPDRLRWSTRNAFGALGAVMEDEPVEVLEVAEVVGSSTRVTRTVMNEVRDAFIVMEQDRPELPSAIIFRDSFMTNASQFFSESFRRVNYCSQPNAVLHDLVEQERPDVVIFEISERRMFKPPLDRTPLDFRAMFGDLLMTDPAALEAQVASRSLLASGDPTAALKANDDALLGGVTARLLTHRARCHTQIGNLAAAVEALRAAVLCDPEDGPVWHELAQALRATQQIPLALEAARNATRLEPEHARHWSTEVTLATEVGQTGEALSRAEAGLALHPDDTGLRFVHGTALVAAGDLGRAISEARTYLAAEPQSVPALGLLASALVQTEQWAEAATVLEGLTSLMPDDPASKFWSDLVQQKLGNVP